MTPIPPLPDQSDGVRQVLMHEALVPAFDAWLAGRGLECRCIGTLSEDDLPSWVVSPTDATMQVAIALDQKQNPMEDA